MSELSQAIEDARLIRELVAEKDKRIAELEAETKGYAKHNNELAAQNKAMATLLDLVLHNHQIGRYSDDCPACAWSKLREAK